jgi:hypothetical protein
LNETVVEFGYGVSIIQIRFSQGFGRHILESIRVKTAQKPGTRLKKDIPPPSPERQHKKYSITAVKLKI